LNISGVETIMSHYTIGYHDSLQIKHEICEYASNAYEAIQDAKEDVPELEGHPHFVDYARLEE
jgi:hypothetical protein